MAAQINIYEKIISNADKKQQKSGETRAICLKIKVEIESCMTTMIE